VLDLQSSSRKTQGAKSSGILQGKVLVFQSHDLIYNYHGRGHVSSRPFALNITTSSDLLANLTACLPSCGTYTTRRTSKQPSIHPNPTIIYEKTSPSTES
jgi:hypothetical protein